MKQCIRLRGISDDVKGKVWEADAMLRAGRLGSLEIVLDDSSVSRRHAEVHFNTSAGWVVRDLESTNGTYLNGVRLGPGEKPIRMRDVVQFGKVAVMVELSETGAPTGPPAAEQIMVEATTSSSWDDALQDFVFDRSRRLRPGEQLLAMLRTQHHLVHMESLDELLTSILNDAVQVLDAQRGAIVLGEGPGNQLKLRALATRRGDDGPGNDTSATALGLGSGRTTLRGDAAQGRFHFSKKMAERCFSQGESILCCSVSEDPELAAAQSIADGAMASLLCVLLRSPRKRLGVLHLDRSFWQAPFTEDDLHLADALAASVSAGIECAQLLAKQRELFLNTIHTLAQAVELRDEYTGCHTKRVTSYALLLGRQLGVTPADLNLLETGTPLHDIGKIGIKDAILTKPGRLTPEEFEEMKTHTTKGAEIVNRIPELVPITPIVRNHHERWDGNGYPDKLFGEKTHLLARIVAVVDAFDAMTSHRPYHPDKPPKTLDEGIEELERHAGKQFDPTCVAAFVQIRDQIDETMKADRQMTLDAAASRPEMQIS